MNVTAADTGPPDDDAVFDPARIERPDPTLLTYYIIMALLSAIGFPFVFLPLYFKYHTLRYAFDEKGVSMSWGLLFRREIYLTFRRIHGEKYLCDAVFGLPSARLDPAERFPDLFLADGFLGRRPNAIG